MVTIMTHLYMTPICLRKHLSLGLLDCDEIAQAIPRTALSLLERDERSPSGILPKFAR